MTAFVTGGTGFVGSYLVEMLRADGVPVRAMVRPTTDLRLLRQLDVQPVMGDLDQPQRLGGICDGCDVVYHAAARVDLIGGDADFHRTTVEGTAAMVRAARHAGVRRFVHVSSCAVYHPDLLTQPEPITEDTPVTTPPRWFRYGRAKLAAEEVVRRESGDMQWVIVRLGYLYGARNRAMKRYLYPLLNNRRMTYVGSGENEMAMLHVADAARATIAAGVHPRAAGRTLIAAGNERVTQKQYFDALTQAMKTPPIRFHMPYRVAYFMAAVAEWVPILQSGGLIQRASIALTGLPQRINCRATQELLGWTPRVQFAEGMREAGEWFQREYLRPAPPRRQAAHESAAEAAN